MSGSNRPTGFRNTAETRRPESTRLCGLSSTLIISTTPSASTSTGHGLGINLVCFCLGTPQNVSRELGKAFCRIFPTRYDDVLTSLYRLGKITRKRKRDSVSTANCSHTNIGQEDSYRLSGSALCVGSSFIALPRTLPPNPGAVIFVLSAHIPTIYWSTRLLTALYLHMKTSFAICCSANEGYVPLLIKPGSSISLLQRKGRMVRDAIVRERMRSAPELPAEQRRK